MIIALLHAELNYVKETQVRCNQKKKEAMVVMISCSINLSPFSFYEIL